MKAINDRIQSLEFNRFAIMTLTITFGSCFGSVAIMFILKNTSSEIPLLFCAISTMFANAMAIGQAPMKTVLYSFTFSLLVNFSLLLWYL